MTDTARKSFVCKISDAECAKLHQYLSEHDFEIGSAPYAHYRAGGDKVSIVAYQSGKLTIQGAKAQEFVEFVLEPEILTDFRLTLSAPVAPATSGKLTEAELPDWTPHIGVDESGKGDFFGPLVVAGVYVDENCREALSKLKVMDSKLIKNDQEIAKIAMGIRTAVQGKFEILTLRPEKYNELYAKIGNLNKLLAWGHARVIENLLGKVPACPRALSDQFAHESLIKRALMERGRQIVMQQRTKGESDIAVAAASILARDQMVQTLKKLGESAGMTLPKGATNVKLQARKLLEQIGAEAMSGYVKTHFKTYNEILK